MNKKLLAIACMSFIIAARAEGDSDSRSSNMDVVKKLAIAYAQTHKNVTFFGLFGVANIPTIASMLKGSSLGRIGLYAVLCNGPLYWALKHNDAETPGKFADFLKRHS